jgi:hypothetical protein
MSNATAPSPTFPPDGLPEPGTDLAPSGGLPFGKTLARVAQIPLRRWKTSLVFCALSAVVALLAGKTLSKTSYTAEGKLLYRPAALPDNLKSIYTPLNKQTVRDLIKTTQRHYETLVKEFGLSLPPHVLGVLFAVDDKLQEDSEVIGLSLEWEDAEEGARLVNRLMGLLREQVTNLRRDEVRKALDGTEEARKQWKESLDAAQDAYTAFLREKETTDPKADLLRRRSEYESTAKERDDALSRQKVKEAQLGRLDEEVKGLRKKQEEAPANATAGDAEYNKNKRDLEQQLAEVETKQSEDKRKLISLQKKAEQLEPLVKPQIVLKSDYEALLQEIKVLEGSVKNLGTRAQGLKTDLKENKPYSAAIRRHLTNMETLKDELIVIQSEISQKADRLQAAREAVSRAERVEVDAIPKLNQIQLAQKSFQELTAKGQELRDLLADLRSEVLINTDAVAGLNPKSNRKKVMTVGFLIPVLCLFGVMIAFEMSSKSWRGESLATRLNLPILARYSPRGAGAAFLPSPSGGEEGGRSPNANECRGLSLRLRQYVPESGGVILFSSLNERNGVEALMADLIGYFSLRDEKVLLLDARIANAEADEIQRCVGRAAARRPVEVVPATDSLTITPGWRRGLVQYLVFEGQNPWDFAVPTRTPAVDYLPAGGPYPITDALASEAMRDLLESCRKKYSLILVVGPSVSKSIDTEILAAYVNGLVLVLNEPLSAFTQETRSFFQSLKETDVPLLGTVLCV